MFAYLFSTVVFNKLNSYPHDPGKAVCCPFCYYFPPVLPLLWGGLADELTDCRHSVGDASARAGELVVIDCYVMVIS